MTKKGGSQDFLKPEDYLQQELALEIRGVHVRTDHRPWELPASPWTWRQSWKDLLFIHWPVPAAMLRHLVPAGLTIQEYEGCSWVGLVPFRMSGVMRRPFPNLPWISAFPELNVRLYVECDGKPGVWFLSLDATNPLAVWAARRFFHLPYFRAAMSLLQEEDWIVYDSARYQDRSKFQARYRPVGPVFESKQGTLEHWLTERYCLYAVDAQGALARCEVHHAPWPLQQGEVEIETNTMLDLHGISTEGSEPLVHFARGIDVVVWPCTRII